MSLRAALEAAVRGEEVPASLLEAAFAEIMDGKAMPVAVGALLTALRTKGETVAEIVAVARALRARAVTAPCLDPRTVDTCGTGGDGAETFNVSTTAAFVVAGAGVPVAKHGNRAASSRAGSIDVLEALGVRADLPIEVSARILREIGIAPFFARRAHPAMRFVAPVRQELGIRTLMNAIGPLLNPTGVRRQLVGVYAASLVVPLATALSALGGERALVVHGEDGLDEVTTTAPTRAAWLSDGRVTPLRLDAQDLGVPRAGLADLRGGDAAENAAIVRAILDGERGPRRDLVLVNAGAALWVAAAAADWAEGFRLATASLEGGAARAKLDALVRATQAVEAAA
jgi:anthranilate phosphoribosyltransferase